MFFPFLGARIEESDLLLGLRINRLLPISLGEIARTASDRSIGEIVRASCLIGNDMFEMKRIAARFLGSMTVFAAAMSKSQQPLAQYIA